MTPLINEMSKLVPKPEESTWFDIGDLANEQTYKFDSDLITHLPFNDICVVCTSHDQNEPVQKFAIYARDVDYTNMKTIAATGFVLTPEFVGFQAFFIGSRDDQLFVTTKDPKTGTLTNAPLEGDVVRICVVLQTLLTRLANNKVTAYEPTVQPTFINKRRLAKKKSPLITWRTVVVEPKPKSEPLGGTHASPRAHERRGHWRQLKTKKVWVKSCKVGKPSNGIVFHDYKVPDISKSKTA